MPEIDWLVFAERFGLPLVILAIFGYLILTGKLRTEREVKDRDDELRAVRKSRDQREEHMRREMETGVTAWKTLYEQERSDRIAAQSEVRDNIDALKVAFTVVEKLESIYRDRDR